MLLTGWFEAHLALAIEPCVPVPGVDLQDRLEFSAATIDATLHKGHGNPPLHQCGCSYLAQAARAIPGSGCLDRFRASFATSSAAVALALDCGLRAYLLAGPGKVLYHGAITQVR